jgi:hypothetical protein
MNQRVRVKVGVPCGDWHYFHATSRHEADEWVDTLRAELLAVGVVPKIYMYADTSLGHIRIDNNE